MSSSDSRSSLLRRLLGALGAALLTALAAVLVGAACFASVARADDSQPAPTTPAATTPEAPPPDPYQPPARTQPKPKPAATHVSAPPVVRSTPVPPARSYTPPPSAVVSPRRSVPVVRAKPHRAKAPHRKRRHVVHREKTHDPVTLSLAPLKELLAATQEPLPLVRSDDGRDTYLRLAGFAFALLAVAALSLHFLSSRWLRAPARVR